MLLFLLMTIPFFSGVFSFYLSRFNKNIPHWISLTGMGLTLLIALEIWFTGDYIFFQLIDYVNTNNQLAVPWIQRFGIEFNIAIDGFSILMIIFTSFLGIIGILCAWNEIDKNEGFFYLNFMLILTGVIGIFISCDLFLFFFFWELILIPMYFLIALWGYEGTHKKKRMIAANKFFLYTQSSGLIMLTAILGLVFAHYHSTNILTFNYNLLIHTPMSFCTECILMLCFFLAFAVKMPIFPFHGWLPDAHFYAPICGAVDIVGILLKTAPYALLRYNILLFPHATHYFSSIIIFLGLINIFYGAIVAFSQTDIKRFIAYSSISHMGLIIIAMYSNNEMALQGAVMQMFSNSLSTAALCILSGQLYKCFKTQDIRKMGGLWKYMYWIPGLTLFFSLANLGLPGTGNFVGEFLILCGVFQVVPVISLFSTIGLVFSAIYSLNMMHNIYYGPSKIKFSMFCISIKELWILIVLLCILIYIGLNPQPILDTSRYSIHNIYTMFNDSLLTIRS